MLVILRGFFREANPAWLFIKTRMMTNMHLAKTLNLFPDLSLFWNECATTAAAL